MSENKNESDVLHLENRMLKRRNNILIYKIGFKFKKFKLTIGKIPKNKIAEIVEKIDVAELFSL